MTTATSVSAPFMVPKRPCWLARLLWIVPIGLGLALGAMSLFYTFLLAGAGHGWNAGVLFGLASLVLFPWSFLTLWRYRQSTKEGSLMLLALAVYLDTVIYLMSWSGMPHRVMGGVRSWAWLWAVWQVAVLITLFIAPTRQQRAAQLTSGEQTAPMTRWPGTGQTNLFRVTAALFHREGERLASTIMWTACGAVAGVLCWIAGWAINWHYYDGLLYQHSLLGVGLFPLAFGNLAYRGPHARGTGWVLLLVALLLDGWLFTYAAIWGARVFQGASYRPWVWLAIWSVWQWAALVAILRRRSGS